MANPNVFRFGEWINSHPEDGKSVEFANKAGMSLLDFGFCLGVRQCFTTAAGFPALTAILDLDRNYSCATELVTFFENHDMPRLQSLGVSDRQLELALVLLLTSRGIPCLYYGCEQYLHNETEGGEDPYNRPMMERWDETPARRLIGILAVERRWNQSIQVGGQWTKWVDENTYVFLRRYRDSRCLVILNKGPERHLEVANLDFEDGEHACLITGEKLMIQEGRATLQLAAESAMVLAKQAPRVSARSVIRLLVNGAPTRPGDRLAVIGDCSELGCWDLERACDLECVNGDCWFGELAFNESAGASIGYKFVIFPAEENRGPFRENRLVRRKLVLPSGHTKWRDRWEE